MTIGKGNQELFKNYHYLNIVDSGKWIEVTISNPPVNVLCREMLNEMMSFLDILEVKEDCHVVIITGAGDKAFVAGADIKDFPFLDPAKGRQSTIHVQRVFGKIAQVPQIIIGAINGTALGGGTELALACDLRLASDDACFGLPEVKLGIMPGAGGTQRLPRLIGTGYAGLMIYTGRTINAKKALEIGLVEEVVSKTELIPAARNLAQEILQNAPLSLRKAKQAVQRGMEMSLTQGLTLEVDALEFLCGTQDQKEGASSFLEKKRPVYKGI
jgi:enoyl-CoA hydratase/carnithine racemase